MLVGEKNEDGRRSLSVDHQERPGYLPPVVMCVYVIRYKCVWMLDLYGQSVAVVTSEKRLIQVYA